MLPRARVQAAIEYCPPDVIPLRVLPSAGGLYEHGQKLLDLHRLCGNDFGDLSGLQLPDGPTADEFGPDGRYHAFRTDAWGTKWEYRIYGIWGHPVEWPLSDWSALDTWQPPAPPASEGATVDAARATIAEAKQRYFTLGGGGSLFEKLHSVRRFEDVLMDITCDTPEINRVADMLTEHSLGCIHHSVALDVDGICFGDDFGTQDAMLLSPAAWRRFFKPRYETLFAPIRAAGKRIFFHVCGCVGDILDDFRELGVDVIWPQLTAFDPAELARRCRDLGLCVELHPDRGDLMQRAQPGEIRDYVLRMVDLFNTAGGGSWLYIEIDPGFPFANAEALFRTAMELRAG